MMKPWTNDARPAARGWPRIPPVACRWSLAAIFAFLSADQLLAFTADLSSGDVSIRLEAVPDTVKPAEDLMLTFTVEAPSHLAVKLPNLQDRFAGFSTAEDFASEPVEANGRKRQVYRWRLTPEPAAPRYRLAPFAVEALDTRASPPRRLSFATKPVVFPGEGQRPAVTGDPEVTPEPDWIAPTAKTVALWLFAALAGLAALAASLYGLTRLSRQIREHRMSPVERAMAELQRLLGRNLPGRGLYKEFYIELTMVVRRYIERTHGIRAPEQTTQEFLQAASKHPLFSPDVLAQLRTFLESADLVKFAGQEATVAMTDDATAKARVYIESDAQQAGHLEQKSGRSPKPEAAPTSEADLTPDTDLRHKAKQQITPVPMHPATSFGEDIEKAIKEPLSAKDKASAIIVALVLVALCVGTWLSPDLVSIDTTQFSGHGGRKIAWILNIIWSRPVGTIAGVIALLVGAGLLFEKKPKG